MANVIEDGLPNPDGEVPWRIALADAEGLFQESVGSFSYRIVLGSVGHVPQMGDEVVIEDGLHLGSAVLTAVIRLEDEGAPCSAMASSRRAPT